MEATETARQALLFAADAQVDPKLAEFLRFLEKAIGLGIPLDLSKLMVGPKPVEDHGFTLTPEATEEFRRLLASYRQPEFRYVTVPSDRTNGPDHYFPGPEG